jgi:O-acetyl-ADP-ribose deacetylase (regulator of RNase III)
MKVIEIQGDLFEHVSEGDAIAHGVNCRGFMGSGIALPIKNKFPNNFLAYNDQCNGQNLLPGDVLASEENGVVVFNMATQFEPGPDARYEWVGLAAANLYGYCRDNDISTVKLPKIGCGIGGLEWDSVRDILEEVGGEDVTLEVYYLEN